MGPLSEVNTLNVVREIKGMEIRAPVTGERLGEATDAAEKALRQYEGPDGFDAPMSARLVTAIK